MLAQALLSSYCSPVDFPKNIRRLSTVAYNMAAAGMDNWGNSACANGSVFSHTRMPL